MNISQNNNEIKDIVFFFLILKKYHKISISVNRSVIFFLNIVEISQNIAQYRNICKKIAIFSYYS